MIHKNNKKNNNNQGVFLELLIAAKKKRKKIKSVKGLQRNSMKKKLREMSGMHNAGK